MAPIVVVVFIAFVLLTRVLFRNSFDYNPDHVEAVMALQERRAITDVKLLVRCLAVLSLVMVAGLGHTGVISSIGNWAVDVIGENYFGAATALLFGSAAWGAFFDNIPYTATMAPIVEGLESLVPDPATGQALWWAFALGADFGGNGTAIAASANVVAIGLAARAGHPISFWQFTKWVIHFTAGSRVRS